MERLSGSGLDLFAGRKLERQFGQLADLIAEDLRPLVETEFRGISLNERAAAPNAVTDALNRMVGTFCSAIGSPRGPVRVRLMRAPATRIGSRQERAPAAANSPAQARTGAGACPAPVRCG
jgi:hypothetical protein